MAKYSTWNHVTQVSNCFYGTKILINENNPRIIDFKTSFLGSEIGASEDKKIELLTNTVYKKPSDSYTRFPATGCVIIAKVLRIVADQGWYYMICNKCKSKANKSQTTNCYNCGRCDEEVSDVYPRIKVQIRMQDETGSASFWLFQQEICKLIDKSPGYLISKAKKVNELVCSDCMSQKNGPKVVRIGILLALKMTTLIQKLEICTSSKQQEKWPAHLHRMFVNAVVQLGGSKAATPAKISSLMKVAGLTHDQIKSHLQNFRLRTSIVDTFIQDNIQPSFTDTAEWTQDMIYYFKERWQKKANLSKTSLYEVSIRETTKIPQTTTNKKRKRSQPDYLKERHESILNEELLHEVEVISSPEYKKAYETESNCQGISKAYIDIGDPIQTCKMCKAKLWTAEAKKGNKKVTKEDSFSMCCMNGIVELSNMENPPEALLKLYTSDDETSKHFRHHIRKYNMMFSFTSMGGKVDNSINNGHGPFVYRMHGQNYHLMGSLIPKDGDIPKFAQLYIFDTENEIDNRYAALRSKSKKKKTEIKKKDRAIANEIKKILDAENPLVKDFRMIGDRIGANNTENVKLKLVEKREKDGRKYNLPTASEVAAIVIGDLDDSGRTRDIILQTKEGKWNRINELHPLYLPLQYPLLFPYADDGYRTDIFLRGVEMESETKMETLNERMVCL
ncbi:putative helitron helicase-like domain-containing protein [Tanacetum coccineum]|uniref:Helitron helicase-like domain-containing protein n=1 Tax=Tanacetum coccineum TaxID=301880 RepID=A0ABQ5EVV5_9ASTR